MPSRHEIVSFMVSFLLSQFDNILGVLLLLSHLESAVEQTPHPPGADSFLILPVLIFPFLPTFSVFFPLSIKDYPVMLKIRSGGT